MITLVRWLDNDERPLPRILDSAPLRQILDEVAGRARSPRGDDRAPTGIEVPSTR